MSSISNLANDIFTNELDSTGVSESAISGWLSENIGALNNYLYTNFSGIGDTISGMRLEEASIYKEMYLYHYYTKQTRNALRGIVGDSDGHILSIKDGDQTISFVNRNEVSKVYRGLAEDSRKRLETLTHKYNSYQASPIQVGGIEADMPTSGVTY